jgi:hypothetical protein
MQRIYFPCTAFYFKNAIFRYKLHERASRCWTALDNLTRAEAEALQALASLRQVLEPGSQQRLIASCNKLLEDIRGQKKTKEKNIINQDQDKTVIANGSQEKIVLTNQRQEKEERDTENPCCAESEHEVRLARNIVEDVDWEKEEEWIKDRNVLVPAFSAAVEIRWVVDRKIPVRMHNI